MSGYRRVNYYELCRLCTSSEGNKMNIFRDEGRRRQLQSKIHSCLPIQVLEEDSLPKIVCHECVKKLENYCEFRETVVSAEGMLESYFTSLRFSEDFLKEGKVYVKSTEKKRPASPDDDPLRSTEKLSPLPNAHIASPEPQQQQQHHQQPVVVSNVNASNIQIISGVQARVQQYKCAMQMQPGGVAAAVVEATAETHYSYQQQTSQQVSQQQQQQPNQTQSQLTQQQSQSQQMQQQTQNQIQAQNQMNPQTQRQIIQQQTQPQIPQQQSQSEISPQQQSQMQITQQHTQSQITQQLQQLQRQQREFEKQQRQHQVQIVQQQEQHQNNNISLKGEQNSEENQQVIQKVISEPQQENDASSQNVQTFTTVQATPEVLLSLGFKDAALTAQAVREETKDFKDFIKVTSDDAMSRNSIGQISEFLRIRTVPEPTSLITVNPQAISQSTRNPICGQCGKSFNNVNQLNNHSCTGHTIVSDVSDSDISKEDSGQTNGSPFSCDVCGKPFKRKEHLFQHRKLHTGERPYACTACGKAFSRKEHLVRHSVSHTGQKMHECEMCGKSFSRKDNLHKHRKTHGVSGPYICETCGKSFVVKHYYLMHLTTHAPTIVDGLVSDPLPYKCDLCHKAYSMKQYLTSHKSRHRSKNNVNHANNMISDNTQQQSSAGNNVNAPTNNVSGSASLNNGNSQTVEIQSVIEGSEQNGAFSANQYHGNMQHFQ